MQKSQEKQQKFILNHDNSLTLVDGSHSLTGYVQMPLNRKDIEQEYAYVISENGSKLKRMMNPIENIRRYAFPEKIIVCIPVSTEPVPKNYFSNYFY